MDSHKNFSGSLVATAPSPATSGLSLIVSAGEGVLFPLPPFNATVCPAGVKPVASNSEMVRVTAIATDTLTIVRQVEGSASRSILAGDQISAAITSKMLDEPTIEDAPGDDVSVPTGFTLLAGDELDLSADVELILEGEVTFS